MSNLKLSYQNIIDKTGIEDRPYQKDFLTNPIYQTPNKPIVLGAGTSSGKTIMAILKLIMFYKNRNNKSKQSLVIPAFQEILRDNFVEQLNEIETLYGKLPFSYKIIKGFNSKQQIKEAIDNGVNVIICLPTTINNNSNLFKNKIEWLYFDEAQYFYLAKMCKDMVKAIKPKYQLLMTGSVAKYNADSNNYIMKYVPVSELHRLGLVSNPRIELVQSSYDLKDTDYKSMFGSLKEGKTDSIAKNIQSLHSVAKEMVLTLKNRFPNLVTNKYYGKRAIRVFGDIDKTIMICHSIPQANCFHKILSKDLKGKVLISHSERPKDEMNIFNKFKTDDSKLLIVVNQGRIGYSMKELFNIVDFSMSKDFEIIQQIVGRLLRISEIQPKKQKIYYKVSTTDLAKWYEYVMRCVMCLMRLEWYSTYKGDKKQFKFPYMVRNQKQPTTKTKSNSKTKSNNRFKISDEFPLDLDYVNYVEQNMKSEYATYAWWDLEDAIKHSKGEWFLSYNDAKNLIQNLGITNSSEFNKLMISKNRPDNIPSNPNLEYSKTNEWNGWGEFLATNRIANQNKEYLPFNKSHKIVLSLGLKNQKEWNEWSKTKRPDNIPSDPFRYEECKSWNHWLGTTHYLDIPSYKRFGYVSYSEAVEYVKGFNIKTSREYFDFVKSKKCKLKLPSNPTNIYKEYGWTNWFDYLNSHEVKTNHNGWNINDLPKIIKIIKNNKCKTRTDISNVLTPKAYRILKSTDFLDKNYPKAVSNQYIV
jgi:superfamily II DNA or RNA helicase